MSEDWFEGEGRSDAEQRFLIALCERARSWTALGITPEDTVAWEWWAPEGRTLSNELVDESYNLLYGTFRVLYDVYEGHQLTGDWCHFQS